MIELFKNIEGSGILLKVIFIVIYCNKFKEKMYIKRNNRNILIFCR